MGLSITLSNWKENSFHSLREKCIYSNGELNRHIHGYVQPIYNCELNETDLPFFDNPDILYTCFQQCDCKLAKVILTSFYCGEPLCDHVVQCQLSDHFTNLVLSDGNHFAILNETSNEDNIEYIQLYIVFIIGSIFFVGNIYKIIYLYVKKFIEYREKINYAPISTVNDKLLEDTCSICIEPYEEGQKIRTLGCNHVFHKECIDSWKNSGNKRCPLCNEDFW